MHRELNKKTLAKVLNGKHVILDSKTAILMALEREFDLTERQQFALGDELFFDKVALATRKGYALFYKLNER